MTAIDPGKRTTTAAADARATPSGWFTRSMDWFVPDKIRREGDGVVSLARTVAAVGLSAVFWGGALVVRDLRAGDLYPFLLAVTLTLGLVSAPFVMRATGSLAPVRAIVLGAAYIAVGGSALAFGGWRSPVFIVLAIIPGFSIAMRGPRLGFALMAASMAFATGVYAADHFGWANFGQPREATHFFLSALVWYVISSLWFIAIWAFDRTNRLSLAQLERSNAEISAARDEADAANRAKSEFLANMSHEMRTPLNGVLGLTEILAQTRLDEQQRQVTERILQSAGTLREVLNQVFDYSTITTDRIVIEKRSFELEDPLDEALRCIALRAEEKGLALTAFVDPALPVRVLGDPAGMSQVLMNLVDNAIKFTEEGEVAVRMLSGSDDEDGCAVVVEIEDTGIGLDAEKAAKLFAPFSQADESTTRRFGGTGLGLAIAREVAHKMGGNLEVESRAGAGSLFRFQVHFEKADDESATSASTGQREKPRVVIVQPHPNRRSVLEKYLSALGVPFAALREPEDEIGWSDGGATAPDLVIADAAVGPQRIAELCARAGGTPRIAFIEAMGTVTASEDWPAGSFRLERPLLRRQVLGCLWPVSTEPDEPAVISERFSGRVLVAEDNAVNQIVLLRMLETFGCEGVVVQNGLEAVDAVRKEAFDLVLLDLHMPVMGGIEATRRIRSDCASGEGCGNPPIVAVSADVTTETRRQADLVGIDAFVAKPFTVDDLRSLLVRFLDPSV